MPEYREMSDNSPAMVWRVGTNRIVDWANKPWLDFTGYTLSESVGHEWSHGIHASDAATSNVSYNNAFDVRESFSATYRLRRFDGEFRWVVDHAAPFLRDGMFAGYFGSVTDINDEHDAHTVLVNALNQRDVLLGEIYHRVKNNLQQIEGLIALESARVADANARQAMQSISSRVRAMAAVHKHLMKASNLKQISTDAFLIDLAAELARTHGTEGKGIEIMAAVDRSTVDIDQAMTLGLAVNELVTNAIKHAFPDGRPGSIGVRFSRAPSGSYLEISDDGVGMENCSVDPDATDGSGLRLVQGFAAQLNGRLSLSSDRGTAVRIDLP